MELTLAAPLIRARRARPVATTEADRRTLGLVLGFLVGLAALGPVAGVGAACLGAFVARFSR